MDRTIRRLRELKNCYSRASGLIPRQIASETFPPEISTRYLPPLYPRPPPTPHPPAGIERRPHSPFRNLTHRIPSETLKTSNCGSKGWKVRCPPVASFTSNDFTMNTDPKGVKQWYKRLVESPMDQRESGCESDEKEGKRENIKGGKGWDSPQG